MVLLVLPRVAISPQAVARPQQPAGVARRQAQAWQVSLVVLLVLPRVAISPQAVARPRVVTHQAVAVSAQVALRQLAAPYLREVP